MKKRSAEALAELFGTPISEGTVSAMTERAADGLSGFLGTVKQRIAQADVAGFDETGLRVAGKLHWVHCARTGKYTLITCHPKRGRTGIDDAGVLARFTGVAVHDAWAPYDTYPDPGHQLCCAHALRELQGVADLAAPESDWCWAGQAADALVAVQNLVADAVAAGASTLDENALATQLQLYRCAAQIGITETAAPRAATRSPSGTTRWPAASSTGKTTPALPHRLAKPAGQQRIRTRYPHDQTSAEDLRLPAHTHRRKTVLRNPKLSLHRGQTR